MLDPGWVLILRRCYHLDTFELIEREGKIAHKVFLDEHGEGLQHIGIWTPDVQAAVREAVTKGCRVTRPWRTSWTMVG